MLGVIWICTNPFTFQSLIPSYYHSLSNSSQLSPEELKALCNINPFKDFDSPTTDGEAKQYKDKAANKLNSAHAELNSANARLDTARKNPSYDKELQELEETKVSIAEIAVMEAQEEMDSYASCDKKHNEYGIQFKVIWDYFMKYKDPITPPKNETKSKRAKLELALGLEKGYYAKEGVDGGALAAKDAYFYNKEAHLQCVYVLTCNRHATFDHPQKNDSINECCNTLLQNGLLSNITKAITDGLGHLQDPKQLNQKRRDSISSYCQFLAEIFFYASFSLKLELNEFEELKELIRILSEILHEPRYDVSDQQAPWYRGYFYFISASNGFCKMYGRFS